MALFFAFAKIVCLLCLLPTPTCVCVCVYLIALAKNSSTMLNKNNENRHSCLFPVWGREGVFFLMSAGSVVISSASFLI